VKIPYGWIRDFVALELSAAQAADRLTNAGVEVGSVTPIAPDVRGVVIAEIEAIEREIGESHGHRLVLCRVATGRERFAVVSGAPNTRVGVRAAFAPPGSVLPGNRRIGIAKIRGVESQGMLCSERELGLGEEHEAGLLALEADAPLGQDLVEHLGLDDHVLEVEITPNRPDCLSVIGVARELAALTGARFSYPALDLKESDEPVDALARVRIEAPDLCHRFTARVIGDVRVAPSPAWMAARLRASGLRPISNVVDITNYVMWEFGQPLHAFDWATLTDHTIVVRRAGDGERIVTLDGQERTLDASMLVIADPARAVGIAGVMGGANTEVSTRTTRVLLESAYFLPASIRRTSGALGLKSDAAYRFERGADIEGLADASARAAQLMAQVAGGVIARGVIDAHPRPRTPVRVALRMSRIERLIGAAPERGAVRRILDGLGLSARDGGPDLEVEVPSFRRDLAMEDDLVEEVIRVWGYDRIPSVLVERPTTAVHQPTSLHQERTVRHALTGAGLLEATTYSFSDPGRSEALRAPVDPEPIALVNPLSQDAALLRAHPLEGLLGAVAVNVRRQQPNVRLFEIGRTYASADGATREPRWVSIALAGARTEPAWYAERAAVDVYDAKGLAELVVSAFGVETRSGAGRLGGFEPDAHGALVAPDGTIVAEFGEVATTVRERFGIEGPVFGAAVSLDALAALPVPTRRYRPMPRFPAVHRDLAFVVEDRALTAGQLEAEIRAAAGPLLRSLAVFDVFRMPDGRRSLAWRLTFQADDRTLTDDEVNRIQDGVARVLSARFAVVHRGI
jgi:phenylalanyl-tRNA synthetase beta chain